MGSRVSKFVAHGHKRIAGWTTRLDAEIFATVMLDQSRRGTKGDALEIGVHHGRSFVVQNLCVADGETAIAIDIFSKQDLNLGNRSGNGDLERFKFNVAHYGDVMKTNILQTSSLDLTAEQMKTHTAGLRFGHIDGGHWFRAVLNDLRLVAPCAGDDCVIALDDFFNPDYPEVAAAYYEWIKERPKFVPMCLSKGKLYLCSAGKEEVYFEALLRNDYIRFHFKTKTDFLDNHVLLITGRYGGMIGLARQYLSFYAPGVFKKLQERRKRTTNSKLLRRSPIEASD